MIFGRGEKGKVVLAMALTVGLMAGCGAGEEPQVLGEKQETTAFGESNSGQEDDGTDAAEKTGVSVKEQVQAPERYQSEMSGDNVALSADAPVLVPEVEQAALKRARAANFTEEEFRQVEKVLAKELSVKWGEMTKDEADSDVKAPGGIQAVTTSAMGTDSAGAAYNLSYRTFEGDSKSVLSLIWMKNVVNDGRSYPGSAHIYEEGEEAGGQQPGTGAKLEEKAEKLIKEAGFTGYQLYEGRWRESYYSLRGKQWAELEYWTTFTPVVEGIGCIKSTINLLGNDVKNGYMNGPYIEVFYNADGTLNEFKVIGKNEVEEKAGKEEFLLPFEAVQQLFEQYCKDYFAAQNGQTMALSPVEGNSSILEDSSGKSKGTTVPEAHVKVKKVKLEYACVNSSDSQRTYEQDLIPVWNFYGSIENPSQPGQKDVQMTEYWTARKEPDGLILSIRADDGQILADAS